MTVPHLAEGMVVVAMSGGVDSAVAAALLARQGVPVVGITLRIWPSLRPADPGQRFDTCCSPAAVDDARGVAERLGIPHYVLNYEAEFDREVIQYFTEAYLRGETPNPCVPCNSRLKFGSLFARATGWGATRVATGHYARVEHHPATGRYRLRRAVDARKDQSYFLYTLSQEQLAAALFPVGHLRKAETRRIARELGLAVAEKPDSQEICFVPTDYRTYLRERAGAAISPGAIRDTGGTVGLAQEFEDNMLADGSPGSNGLMDGVDVMPDALASTVLPALGFGSPLSRAFGLAQAPARLVGLAGAGAGGGQVHQDFGRPVAPRPPLVKGLRRHPALMPKSLVATGPVALRKGRRSPRRARHPEEEEPCRRRPRHHFARALPRRAPPAADALEAQQQHRPGRAPGKAGHRALDQTLAARQPVLRWTPQVT